MELSFVSSTPARQSSDTHDGITPSPNVNVLHAPSANGKFKHRPRPPTRPLVIPTGHVAFRLLCPASKIGSVIGKSGGVVNLISQEIGAKIHVEDAVPACDELVVLIIGPTARKAAAAKPGGEEADGGDNSNVSPVQEALFRVFDRILEVDELGGLTTGGAISCRLLVPTGQVGRVMGKGGKVIAKIRKDSGARIRVLPSDQLPACALPSDEVMQITGDASAVEKALLAVSHRMQESPLSNKAQVVVSLPATPGTYSDAQEENLHKLGASTSGGYANYAGRGQQLPTIVDRIPMPDLKKAQQEVSFRLLCPNDRVGVVIGKGGTIVKALQNETGASISVAPSVANSEQRVITIFAMEDPESHFSPAQNAVIRVLARSLEVGVQKGLDLGSGKGAQLFARLLVPSNQIGCLMGKGGTIIAEMRKATGAGIWILTGDQVPKCASKNDEVVQIHGDFQAIQDVLRQVTGRLRDNILSSKATDGTGGGVYSPTIPKTASFGRARETKSPRRYSSLGFSNNIDHHASLAHGIDHLGLSNNIDHPSSPKIWSSYRSRKPDTSSMSNTDLGRSLPSLRCGEELRSGNKSVIVTNTTVEIIVPENVIGSVYGENGCNLNRIRQISGAKVVVHDPHPGTRDGMVVISGTPVQTQAAQSLLQAFILG